MVKLENKDKLSRQQKELVIYLKACSCFWNKKEIITKAYYSFIKTFHPRSENTYWKHLCIQTTLTMLQRHYKKLTIKSKCLPKNYLFLNCKPILTAHSFCLLHIPITVQISDGLGVLAVDFHTSVLHYTGN